MPTRQSYRWIVPIILVAACALLLAPFIMWKYVAARNMSGSATYSNVRYMEEVKGKVGSELQVEFDGTRVTATLSDHDGTPEVARTILKGTVDGRHLKLLGEGPRGKIEITGRAEGAAFDGFIIRWIGPGQDDKDKVEHPLLLKRVSAQGELQPAEE
ncbi:MAG TPA: hypothetical protein VM056_01315 [Terriglobales bacterium]|nr:hypothetical protein [Terriglobales bacterium]